MALSFFFVVNVVLFLFLWLYGMFCDTFGIIFSVQDFIILGSFPIPHHFKLLSVSVKNVLKFVLRLYQIYIFLLLLL